MHKVRDEYSTLREELLQAKRYLFERPLLIVALGVGGFTSLKVGKDGVAGAAGATGAAGVMAFLLTSLILFNQIFTVSRFMSASRIVAYIQLALEERVAGSDLGWESSLRCYRMWINRGEKKIKRIMDAKIDKKAIPNSTFLYPLVYYFHILVFVGTAAGLVYLVCIDSSLLNVLSLIGVALIAIFFSRYCKSHPPSEICKLDERNRVLWNYVFRYMRFKRNRSCCNTSGAIGTIFGRSRNAQPGSGIIGLGRNRKSGMP